MQNVKLFNNLYERIRNKDDYEITECKRYIKTNETEKKWLTNAIILNYTKIAKNTFFIAISFDNAEYACITGIPADEFDYTEELLHIELNAGLATILAGEGLLVVPDGIPDTTIAEYFYDTSDEKLNYEGHEWDDLSCLYVNAVVFQLCFKSVTVSTKNSREYYWIGLNLLTRNSIAYNNSYSKECLKAWQKLVIEQYSEKISYRGLLYAYCATSWEISYLHLYQCIEDIFITHPIRTLYAGLDISTDYSVFEAAVHSSLSLRDDAITGLSALIEKIDTNNNAYTLLSKHAANANQGVEIWIYKMRNRIVHQTDESFIKCNEHDKWDEVIQGMLYLITNLL